MNIKNDFDEYFDKLDKNSFAYLSLTSKIERPIRDNFAYFLYKKYHENKLISIEYTDSKIKRADLVILGLTGKPEIVIEFKACYDFDLIERRIQEYVVAIMSDYIKHKDVKNIKKYYVLLASSPKKAPEPKTIYDKIVKYYNYIKNFIVYDTEENNFNELKNNVNNAFSSSPLKAIYYKNKKLGNAFNVECGLYCVVFEEKKVKHEKQTAHNKR